MRAPPRSLEETDEPRATRGAPWAALALIAVAAGALLIDGLLPGRALLPLLPHDLPEWRVGATGEPGPRHPHPNWCMADVVHLLIPGLAVNAAAAERGEWPLRDDGQALGVPHLAELHYGVLYPPAWLAVAFGLPGLAWMAWLHLLLAGAGMLGYLRATRHSGTAALAGAFAFAFSAWLTARLQSFPAAGAAVWLPWVLWGLESGTRRGAVGAGMALALSLFAGFPQVTIWIVVLAVLLEVVRAGAAVRAGRPCARRAALAAAALTLGGLLALPQLAPTAELLARDSVRGEVSVQAVLSERLEAPLLWHLLVPDLLASSAVAGGHPLALERLEQARRPAAANRAETSMGIGALGLVLAGVGLVLARGWRARSFALLAAGGLLVLCVPALLEAAASVLPPLRTGNPKRLLLLVSFALAVLAAGGLDVLRGRALRATVLAWSVAVAVTVLSLVALFGVPSTEFPAEVEAWAARVASSLSEPGLDAATLLQHVPAEDFVRAGQAARRGALIALAAGVAAIVAFRPRRRAGVEGWETAARRAPGWVVALLVAELGLTAWPMLRGARAEHASARPAEIAAWDEPPLARLLRDAAGSDGVPPRLARFGNDPPWLRPNLPLLYGLTDLQAYAPMVPRRVAELLQAVEPGLLLSGSILGGFSDARSLEHPLVDALSLRLLITDRDDVRPAGWREHGRLGPVAVLVNEEALPRAVYVQSVACLPDAAARLARLSSASFDPRSEVVLEDAEACARADAVLAALAPTEVGRSRALALSRRSPRELLLAVGPGPPGLVVISEGWQPGWRARADGVETPVWRADHALLAVPVASRDDHEVLLRFDPPLVTTSAWWGAGAWLAALGLLAWPRRARTAP